MRNTSKMTTLENRFPLLAVEHGCIISKDADITVAFEVELPELYTVTGAEYEAIHSCWCKAIKVLPDYSVVHKQDWFIKERYKPELQKDDMSFLSGTGPSFLCRLAEAVSCFQSPCGLPSLCAKVRFCPYWKRRLFFSSAKPGDFLFYLRI